MGILIQNTDTSGAVVYVGRRGASYHYAAMKFNFAYPIVVTGVGLYWGAKVSTGQYLSPLIDIWNDDGGGLPMQGSIRQVSAGSPANNAGWLDHTFATGALLNANTDYWIIAENGGSQEDENSNALNTASSGAMKVSTDNIATWNNVARDLSYKLYGGRVGSNQAIII